MGIYLISANTASGTPAVIEITGIDATYNEYQFQAVNMHPATNNVNFTFQVNAAVGVDFDEAITSTAFRAYLNESGSGGALGYDGNSDQANADEVYQRILSTGTGGASGADDESVSGVLTLYDPSSTTYVKHFLAEGNGYDHGNWAVTMKTAGYINTTSAIDEISFKMSSGNTDSGVIKMYGLAKS